MLIKICNYLHVLTAIKATLVSGSAGDRDLVDLTSTISSLIDDIEELYTRWALIEAGIGRSSAHLYRAPRVNIGRGRPKVVIEQEKILFLRELRFNWSQISALFGVSCRTLYNIRLTYGMTGEDNFSPVSDQELL